MESHNHERIDLMPRPADCVVALCVFLMGFVSLLAAYQWFTSDAWQEAFGLEGNGWWYELGRLALGVAVTLYLLGTAYRDEAARLLTLRAPQDPTRQLRQARWAVFSLGFCAIITLIAFHTVWGPNELRSRTMAGSGDPSGWVLARQEDRRDFLYPYLAYAGYSIANMIAILFVISSVGLMGAVKDVRRVSSSGSQVFHDAGQSDLSTALRSLRGMKLDFQCHIRRASVLLAGLILVIAYERVLGWPTLSEGGKKFAIAAYIVMGLSATFVFFSHHAYGDAYARVLRASDHDHDEEVERYTPASVWMQARTRFPLILFVLGAIAIIVKDIVYPLF